ncbi:teichoic acid D-Ala incorporation-associated protein DltX [Listeria grayi]|uniref:teichoic acid D-Ala incorporation-associated protein DltX n=1 Tax=Listeria grayi TaxID=1641 RepID=UPI00351A6CDC
MRKGGFYHETKIIAHKTNCYFLPAHIVLFAYLFGLFWFYGFKNPNGAQFIYNEF